MQALGVKGDIQRTDSFQAISNIVSYSRLRLLVEVLIRLHRVLSDSDKQRFAEMFKPYVKEDAGHYVHKLEKSDVPDELEQLGRIYFKLHDAFKEQYGELEIFHLFERALNDHFVRTDERIEVRAAEDIPTDSLQSPDDPDATYRNKNGKKTRGQAVSVTETANPENELDLLTDVAMAPNNEDDGNIHEKRVGKIKEKNPEFEENHTDGGYGNEASDREMEKHEVRHVVTGIRGHRSEVEIDIVENDDTYCVSCPKQNVIATKARKRWKAAFDHDICLDCAFAESCPTQQLKSGRAFYFERKDFLARQRWKNLQKIPENRRNLRPNVEATIKEFTRVFNHKGKLPYRGGFRAGVYAFSMAIGINFGRIMRHQRKKARENAASLRNLPHGMGMASQKTHDFVFQLAKRVFEGYGSRLNHDYVLG